MTKKRIGDQPEMSLVNASAAFVDIGSTIHRAAVSPNACDSPGVPPSGGPV